MCPGVDRWDGLGGLPTPYVVLSAGGTHSPLLLLPALQKAVGFLVFLYFVVHHLPNCTCTQLFLVL